MRALKVVTALAACTAALTVHAQSVQGHGIAGFWSMAPGPTPVPPEVLLAQGSPLVYHRGPGYGALLREVTESLKQVYRTRGDVLIFASSGTGGLESAVGLATQPRTEVALSHRGRDFPRAKERNVARLRDAEASGSIRVLRESAVTSIEPDQVTLALPGGPMVLPNDFVIVRIGGEPPDRFLAKIGIAKVVKELPLEKARDAVAP